MQIHLPTTLQEQLQVLNSTKLRPSQATLITNHVRDNVFNHVRNEYNNLISK